MSDKPSPPAIHLLSIRRSIFGYLLLVIFLIGFGIFFYKTAGVLIEQTNQNPHSSDQSQNMFLTEKHRDLRLSKEHERWSDLLWRKLPHYTDGVINPLWPWFADLVLPRDADFVSGDSAASEANKEVFVAGKWLNVIISGVFLVGLAFWLMRSFSLLATFNMVVVVAMGAFLPRAVFYQPEPIFYAFFFISFALCVQILRANQLWQYALLGVTVGLAWLAKASVLPMVGIFLGVSSYRVVVDVLPGLFRTQGRARPQSRWNPSNHIIGLAFLATAFLAVAGPRMLFSSQKFGSAMHSYPASYWMWLDDFDSCLSFMQQHPDAESLSAASNPDLPSLSQYYFNHSNEQMKNRLLDGSWAQIEDFFCPPEPLAARSDSGVTPAERAVLTKRWLVPAIAGVGLVFLLAQMILATPRAQSGAEKIEPESGNIVGFTIATFLAYIVLFGWYTPIGRGERFMLMLFAPVVYMVFMGMEGAARRIRRRKKMSGYPLLYIVGQLCVSGVLIYRVVKLLHNPNFIDP